VRERERERESEREWREREREREREASDDPPSVVLEQLHLTRNTYHPVGMIG